jgi:ABC-2 type transport system ATP-binding protein
VAGLIGVNGAGKSTLLRILVGLERPDEGEVAVLGEDPALEAIPVRRRVGYMPEKRGIYEWMTVAEVIAFVASFYPDWDPARAEELRERFDLDPGRKVGHLSRGQYARLAFLLTLGHRPELVVLDEPSYGLDPIVRRTFLSTIVEVVAEEGTTVLLSSHLMHEVERIADRVFMLHRGRLLLAAPLDDLLARTRLLRLPHDFDPAPLAGRLLRSNRDEGEWTAVMTDFREVDHALLSPGAAVEPLGLEDIFCEYALAADETGRFAGQ